MDVRLARPTDAPLAFALALDESAHIVKNFGWPAANPVSRTTFRAVIPFALPGRTWIARDGADVALLEAQPRRYVIGWDITRLVARGRHDVVVAGVLGAATEHVRSHGVPRLFARCHPMMCEELKASAFSALAHEYILAGPATAPCGEADLPIDSRYRMPQDAWPLHQLESEVTPPLVRQMEGLTSLDWSTKLRNMSEIVVEREDRVVAWIGWGVDLGRGFTQIGLLVHPRHREVATDLLHHVLVSAPPGTHFAARVRDYQSDVLRAFEAATFQGIGEEVLMVKHGSVELAKSRSWLKVAAVPSIHAFHHRIGGTRQGYDHP